ncbi:MAG: hypothetical protein AAB316_06235, partial [Bacteroidota bacterium]
HSINNQQSCNRQSSIKELLRKVCRLTSPRRKAAPLLGSAAAPLLIHLFTLRRFLNSLVQEPVGLRNKL